jgi:hypothetical protein
MFFEKTAGGPGLTIQGYYAIDGPIPAIAAKDIGKFALIAFKDPNKYIGRPLNAFNAMFTRNSDFPGPRRED